MSRSFRLDPELEQRLKEAAAREGVPASELIRNAISRHCDEVLGGTLMDELGGIVGSVAIGGDESSRTGEAFSKLLRAKSEPRTP